MTLDSRPAAFYSTKGRTVLAFSEDEAREIRRKALSVAHRRGYASRAEDFANWLFTIEVDRVKRAIAWKSFRRLLSDFIRGEDGRSNSPEGSAPRRRYLDRNSPLDKSAPLETLVAPETGSSPLVLNGLDREFRAILILRHKWGFSSAEIAEVFGVSESAIEVKTFNETKELRKKLKGELHG